VNTLRARETKMSALGPVQQKLLRICELSPHSELLVNAREARAARRLAKRGRVTVYRDDFGVWVKLLSEASRGR
jgi:hypothetical protein